MSQKNVIHFVGHINPVTVNNIRSAILPALKQGTTEIELMLSSEGGDINSGLALYNFLRVIPVPLTTVNIGSVESIAVIVYLAGDKRLAVDNSRFLIHSFNANFPFNGVDYSRLSERTASLDDYAKTYSYIFNYRTKHAQTPVNIDHTLRGDALIIDSAAATSAGIVTEIITSERKISAADVHWWVAP